MSARFCQATGPPGQEIADQTVASVRLSHSNLADDGNISGVRGNYITDRRVVNIEGDGEPLSFAWIRAYGAKAFASFFFNSDSGSLGHHPIVKRTVRDGLKEGVEENVVEVACRSICEPSNFQRNRSVACPFHGHSSNFE